MKLPVERAVALLTPAFAAVSAALTGWLGTHFPGLHVNPADITSLELAGAATALGGAMTWLHGRQKFLSQAASVEAFVRSEVAKATAGQQAGPALDDIEDLLRSHTDQIVQMIATAVHAPPSVAQVVETILAQAAQGKPAEQPPVAATVDATRQATVTGPAQIQTFQSAGAPAPSPAPEASA